MSCKGHGGLSLREAVDGCVHWQVQLGSALAGTIQHSARKTVPGRWNQLELIQLTVLPWHLNSAQRTTRGTGTLLQRSMGHSAEHSTAQRTEPDRSAAHRNTGPSVRPTIKVQVKPVIPHSTQPQPCPEALTHPHRLVGSLHAHHPPPLHWRRSDQTARDTPSTPGKDPPPPSQSHFPCVLYCTECISLPPFGPPWARLARWEFSGSDNG